MNSSVAQNPQYRCVQQLVIAPRTRIIEITRDIFREMERGTFSLIRMLISQNCHHHLALQRWRSHFSKFQNSLIDDIIHATFLVFSQTTRLFVIFPICLPNPLAWHPNGWRHLKKIHDLFCGRAKIGGGNNSLLRGEIF